ncbi:MAG: arginine repressor [Oligoflexia bacterium]|nr:arginine repressor [Oligoflexia bacterium]
MGVRTSTGNSDGKSRLEALRQLLSQGKLSTQDELREELEAKKFQVTQSTISRDLRRIGAVKGTAPDGRTVYRLSGDLSAPVPVANGSLRDLVKTIESNGSMIVIHTLSGSASLVALHLDRVRPGDILGTLAGDDTIFIAPRSVKKIKETIALIERSFD